MLTSIFHPRQPKTPLDLLTIASLSLQLAIYFFTSRTFSQIFFFFYFAIWRASYNAGLGYILKQQSERGWIVKEVKRNGWFDEKKQPKVREWIKQQLVTKMDKDYNFEVSHWEKDEGIGEVGREEEGDGRFPDFQEDCEMEASFVIRRTCEEGSSYLGISASLDSCLSPNDSPVDGQGFNSWKVA